MQRQVFRAMGSQIVVLLDADDPSKVTNHLAAVPNWFASWEQCLSRFRDDSELAHVNRNTGRYVPVSPVLWDVLQHALRASHQSAGLVTPTLLDALEATGYDHSFADPLSSDALQSTAMHQTMVSRQPVCIDDWLAIELDPTTHSLYLPIGVRLDLGGIAKGWAAQQAMQCLAAHGPVLVNAGGDIAVSGRRAYGSRWPIGIIDPLTPDHQLEVLMLDSGGVATSGRDYRRWQHNGRWQHHILDPRTGQPAETDILSATIIAPTACEAEMAAKIALILGSDAALNWLAEHPPFAGLLVLDDGTVAQSHRFHTYLWKGYHDGED